MGPKLLNFEKNQTEKKIRKKNTEKRQRKVSQNMPMAVKKWLKKERLGTAFFSSSLHNKINYTRTAIHETINKGNDLRGSAILNENGNELFIEARTPPE